MDAWRTSCPKLPVWEVLTIVVWSQRCWRTDVPWFGLHLQVLTFFGSGGHLQRPRRCEPRKRTTDYAISAVTARLRPHDRFRARARPGSVRKPLCAHGPNRPRGARDDPRGFFSKFRLPSVRWRNCDADALLQGFVSVSGLSFSGARGKLALPRCAGFPAFRGASRRSRSATTRSMPVAQGWSWECEWARLSFSV